MSEEIPAAAVRTRRARDRGWATGPAQHFLTGICSIFCIQIFKTAREAWRLAVDNRRNPCHRWNQLLCYWFVLHKFYLCLVVLGHLSRRTYHKWIGSKRDYQHIRRSVARNRFSPNSSQLHSCSFDTMKQNVLDVLKGLHVSAVSTVF